MTPEEWEAKWNEVFAATRKKYPTESLSLLQRLVTEFMIKKYGPKPPNPLPKPGVIGVIKLGLNVKRGWSMFKLTPAVIVAAVVAGASAFGGAYSVAMTDSIVSTAEWIGIVWATISAVLGGLFQSAPKPPVA